MGLGAHLIDAAIRDPRPCAPQPPLLSSLDRGRSLAHCGSQPILAGGAHASDKEQNSPTDSTADDLCRQLSTDSIAGSVTESAFVYIWAPMFPSTLSKVSMRRTVEL